MAAHGRAEANEEMSTLIGRRYLKPSRSRLAVSLLSLARQRVVCPGQVRHSPSVRTKHDPMWARVSLEVRASPVDPRTLRMMQVVFKPKPGVPEHEARDGAPVPQVDADVEVAGPDSHAAEPDRTLRRFAG